MKRMMGIKDDKKIRNAIIAMMIPSETTGSGRELVYKKKKKRHNLIYKWLRKEVESHCQI